MNNVHDECIIQCVKKVLKNKYFTKHLAFLLISHRILTTPFNFFPMGARSRHYDMNEIDSTKSSAKAAKHQAMIERFLSQGYTIESKDEKEERGLGNELISKTTTTILKAPSLAMPMVKFFAKEVFGNYDYEEQLFDDFEFSNFSTQVFTKGSDAKSFNDDWSPFNLD
ncbi:hypothetical protein COB57_01740 [Candidatus Peregrinibacteria bacterium]|nr:MAG: hypothetical protein COB57_01740 [Candidatus Peregrinibacteria bacterium]